MERAIVGFDSVLAFVGMRDSVSDCAAAAGTVLYVVDLFRCIMLSSLCNQQLLEAYPVSIAIFQ